MTQPLTDWRSWKRRFAGRAGRPLPALEADHDYDLLPPSVARSLAVFQLGESGGGSVVAQARSSDLEGIDEDYAAALEYFVAEEHYHANVLAMCVRLMRGRLVRSNWTAKLFVIGRRLMGLRLKILVLLAAEIVGLCFYRMIAERLPPGVVRSWLEDIVADEEDHLRFHCEFLQSQVEGVASRLLFIATWRAVMYASGVVVLIDHREMLRDLHIEHDHAWSRWQALARDAEKRVLARPRTEPAGARSAVRLGS